MNCFNYLFAALAIFSVASADLLSSTIKECVGLEAGTFLPYPGDCTKFIQCDFTKHYIIDCPHDLEWDSQNSGCSLPELAGCSHGSASLLRAGCTSGCKPQPTNPPATTAPTSAPPGTGGDCIHGEYSPHKDCSKFYQCVWGVNVEQQCAPGTLWNQEILTCDWPENVECGGGSGSTTSGTTSSGQTVTTSSTGTTSGQTGTTSGQTTGTTSAGAGGDCIHGEYSPHKDCSKFYQCVWGVNVEQQCAPGTFWNQEILTCDWPENVDCGGGSGSTTSGTTSSGQTGTTSGQTTGTTSAGTGGDCIHGEYSPHKDCSKFYQCVWGVNVEQQCAPGTLWNQEILTCDWPENVDCEGGSGSTTSGTTTSGQTVTTSSTGTTSGQTGTTSGQTTGTTSAGTGGDCIHGEYSPHKDCSKFYQCVWGVNVEQQCAPGTLWNQEILTCDWPENVDCGGGQGTGTQPPATTPPTTNAPGCNKCGSNSKKNVLAKQRLAKAFKGV